MKYFVTLGDETIEVELGGDEHIVGGDPVDGELSTLEGTPLRVLRTGSSFHEVVARPAGPAGRWRITIGGRTAEVRVLDERTRALADVTGDAHQDGPRQIVAPMPGLVVRVNVAPGDQVSAGQGVIVVEAMKMENELKAPSDGVVAAVEVATGAAVEKGTILITLE